LVQHGILKRVGRGKFKLGEEKNYIPEISDKLKSIFEKMRDDFPYLDICVWNTSVLNEFTVHQPFHFFTLVEVESEATRSVFFFLKESEDFVFHEPDREILAYHLPEGESVFIVNSLVSEAPLQMVDNVRTATLEKILVDVFSETSLFFAYQGVELSRIFKEAFNKYTINENRLLRYADRRGKRERLSHFLKENKLLAVKPN
jgi:hypothetical protein